MQQFLEMTKGRGTEFVLGKITKPSTGSVVREGEECQMHVRLFSRIFLRGTDMRIRMVTDRKLFSGTPSEIFQQMREKDHQTYESLDAYLQECLRRWQMFGEDVKITGSDNDERFLSFLRAMVDKGVAKLEVSSPEHVDKYVVALVRSTLGISQERLAHQLGVAFSTVNRWERGKTQPHSAAIADRVNRVVKKITS